MELAWLVPVSLTEAGALFAAAAALPMWRRIVSCCTWWDIHLRWWLGCLAERNGWYCILQTALRRRWSCLGTWAAAPGSKEDADGGNDIWWYGLKRSDASDGYGGGGCWLDMWWETGSLLRDWIVISFLDLDVVVEVALFKAGLSIAQHSWSLVLTYIIALVHMP